MGKRESHPLKPQARSNRSLGLEDRARLRKYLAAAGFTNGSRSLGITNDQARALIAGEPRTSRAIDTLVAKLDALVPAPAALLALADAVPVGVISARAVFIHAEGDATTIASAMGLAAAMLGGRSVA